MGLAVNQILRWWGGLRSSVWSKNKGTGETGSPGPSPGSPTAPNPLISYFYISSDPSKKCELSLI